MLPSRKRALGFLVGAVACFAAISAGSEWSDGYLMQYGTFLPSRGEFAFKLHVLLFGLPGTVLLALAAAETAVGTRLLAGFDALARRRRLWLWAGALACLTLALAMTVRWGVLRGTPVTDDENVYHFQAQLLASGRLYADSPPPPVRAFFDNQFIVNNGRWFGTYFVGHATVLMLAATVGLQEWIVALEAALTLLLGVATARRLLGQRVAILTGCLLALSPFFVFMGATHLSQPTSSLMLAVFVYAALRIEGAAAATRWWGAAAAALAYCVLVRPQTAAFLSLPFALRLALLAARGRLRPGAAPVVVAAAVLGAGAAVFLGINHALTGSALRTAYHAAWQQGTQWPFPIGPLPTIREISQNVAQLDFWLLGWPISLAFVPFFQRDGRTWTLAAMPAAALAGYGLIAIPTVAAVGPVYYTETIVPLTILSASGIERALGLCRTRFGESRPTRALAAWPLACTLCALLVFVPVEVASLRLMATLVRAPYDLVEERGLDNAVVFVQTLPALHVHPGAWVYYHRNNSPDLSDRVLFVRYLGPEKNKVLMRYLPSRKPYTMGMRGSELLLLPLAP